ncbi:MAG: hypothetical protein JNK29_13590 [Anaerolineales bacterium]|nr:hypothetical protein [Anaerolineales bacterium]
MAKRGDGRAGRIARAARWLIAWLGLSLTACAAAERQPFNPYPTTLAGPVGTAAINVSFVNTRPLAARTPTPAPPTCANSVPVCWTEADKAKVAHICYDEARGLLTPGMASCASTVARRQLQPDWYGGPDLDDLLRWEQFRVDAALTRPWEQGLPPPAEALAAVNTFLAGETAEGCWGYDSFRGVTPDEAQAFWAEAPERRCAVVRGAQAMVFFNWRNP